MRDLDLLALWEHGAGRAAPECALALLAAAQHTAGDELLALSASERDAQLLELRARLFGDHISARALCPVCARDIELETRASALRAHTSVATEEHVLAGDTLLRIRAPTARSLVMAAGCPDVDSARQLLLEQSVQHADGTPVSSLDDWPATTRTAVFDALDRIAGPAALQLRVTCAYCDTTADIDFDIVSFLWYELTIEARRMAGEVVELARELGWSEQEIRTMSSARRRLYLEIVRA